MIAHPNVYGFYEPDTGSVQYVLVCPETRDAAIIDAVWNFDPRSGHTHTHSADEILRFVDREGLTVRWILDTHPHADHFMAAGYLQDRLGAPTAIGARTALVTELWRQNYDVGSDILPDPDRVWDRVFKDGDRFEVGKIPVQVMLCPGHTLASITYLAGDAAFVHDTLFQPDQGTARADFPGGDARQLWQSIQTILALPDETRTFTGHDYRPGGREAAWESTVGEQKLRNTHLGLGQTEDGFVQMRTQRDQTLPLPDRMLAALMVNLRGGRMPTAHGNGISYVPLPLDADLHAPVPGVRAHAAE